MGNCIETWTQSHGEEGEMQEQREEVSAAAAEADQGEEKAGGFGKEGGFKIKILLTKEELEWLLLQLNEKGGKRLEDALVEIEKGRGRNEGWKPSLESILESPEIQTVEMC